MRTILINCILFLLFVSAAALAQDIQNDSLDLTNTDTVLDASSVSQASTNEEPLYPISQERKAKLISYSKFNNVWRFVSFFTGLIIMSLFLFTGLSAKIRDWFKPIKIKLFAYWLYFFVFVIFNYIIEFPLNYYRGFVVESDYGFMNQTFTEWFSEDLMTLCLTLVFGGIPFLFLYWLIKKSKRWWLYFSAASIPFIVLVMIVVPIYIMPLYNDFEPLKDETLRTELLALADKAGIENPDLFQVNASKQSTKVNAYVTGLFGSKRIVLYDTLIDNFEIDEIKFVMGHEMGHYVKNHIWYGLALAILFICFSFWLTDKLIHVVISKFKDKFKFDTLADVASLPLIMIFVSLISFAFNPVSNTFSRYQEHQSDIYGMEITDVSGESAAIAFDKLSVLNLSDPDPHPIIEFWFYSHPALKKRMEFVRNYQP